jgi:hypothetical protein
MEKKFFDWLAANPQLAKYAGQRGPANQFRTGWVNTFDVRISQQLPGFMKGHKSEIWLDIQNVGNMLNKKWGNIYDYGFYANAVLPTCRACTTASTCTTTVARTCRASPTRMLTASTSVSRSGRCSWASATSSDALT